MQTVSEKGGAAVKKVRSRGFVPPEYKTGIAVSCAMVAVAAACIVLTLSAVKWKHTAAPSEPLSEVKWHWVTEEKLPPGKKILEKREQFRFRKKQFRNGRMMSVMPGWELYNVNKIWSDEIETTSDSFIAESDPETLEYRTETHYEDIKNIQYNYKRYHYREHGRDVYTFTQAHGGGQWEYNILAYELEKGGLYENRQTRVDESGGIWFKAGLNNESELTENKTVTVISSPYTVYYFRKATFSFDFFRWSNYSSWSFTKPAENENIETESRTVYKVEL